MGGEVKALEAAQEQADAEAEERKAAARKAAEEEGEDFDEEADYSRPATVSDETFIAEKDFVTCTVTVERENLPLAQHYERRSDDGEDAPLVVRVARVLSPRPAPFPPSLPLRARASSTVHHPHHPLTNQPTDATLSYDAPATRYRRRRRHAGVGH